MDGHDAGEGGQIRDSDSYENHLRIVEFTAPSDLSSVRGVLYEYLDAISARLRAQWIAIITHKVSDIVRNLMCGCRWFSGLGGKIISSILTYRQNIPSGYPPCWMHIFGPWSLSQTPSQMYQHNKPKCLGRRQSVRVQ